MRTRAEKVGGGYRLTPYVKVNWRDKAYFDMRNSEFAHIGRYQKAYAMGDVSARHAAEQELRRSESRWRTYLKIASEIASGIPQVPTR